jgi:hypothetical protein
MKAKRSWIAMDSMVFDHPVIQSLTDTQKVAFFMTICKAKMLRNGGEFRDRRHLAGIIGVSYARAIPRLIAEGLLSESQSGFVTISNYSHWQVDATSAERQRRHRARIASESRFGHTTTRQDTDRTRQDTLTNGVMSVGEIILRGGKA